MIGWCLYYYTFLYLSIYLMIGCGRPKPAKRPPPVADLDSMVADCLKVGIDFHVGSRKVDLIFADLAANKSSRFPLSAKKLSYYAIPKNPANRGGKN